MRRRTQREHPPGGGAAGDDGDVGLLWLAAAVGVGGGDQAGRNLLVNQVLAGQNALAVVCVLALLVLVNHPDVLGHLFELVGQSLTLHLGQDAPLVVIPASNRTPARESVRATALSSNSRGRDLGQQGFSAG